MTGMAPWPKTMPVTSAAGGEICHRAEFCHWSFYVTAAVRTERVSIEFVVTVYLHKRCPAEELAGGLDDCPSRPARMVVATRRTNCRLSPGSLTTPACTAAPILPEKSSCMQLSIQLIQLCAFGGKRTVNPCLL